MATSTAATGAQRAAAIASARARSAALNDPRNQAIKDNATARERAAASSARSAERQDIAARNLAANRAEHAHSWQMPLKNPLQTSGFGWRWGRLHAGEDFAAAVGTNLVAMSTGTVAFAGPESGYGTMVKIRYWDGTVSFYAHMSRISVTEGEAVEPGQIVGRSGNTGESTGPHLHLEIHPDNGEAVNPVPWLADHHLFV
jgi:murein DD-endopeptidase MepM/ murein hydrolase activator NlpD